MQVSHQTSIHSSQKLLTHNKQGLHKYCKTAYVRNGISKIWNLKNWKEL